jgi:hypothetical protein
VKYTNGEHIVELTEATIADFKHDFHRGSLYTSTCEVQALTGMELMTCHKLVCAVVERKKPDGTPIDWGWEPMQTWTDGTVSYDLPVSLIKEAKAYYAQNGMTLRMHIKIAKYLKVRPMDIQDMVYQILGMKHSDLSSRYSDSDDWGWTCVS